MKAGNEVDETQGACRQKPPDFLGMQVAYRTVKSEWNCGEHLTPEEERARRAFMRKMWGLDN